MTNSGASAEGRWIHPRPGSGDAQRGSVRSATSHPTALRGPGGRQALGQDAVPSGSPSGPRLLRCAAASLRKGQPVQQLASPLLGTESRAAPFLLSHLQLMNSGSCLAMTCFTTAGLARSRCRDCSPAPLGHLCSGVCVCGGGSCGGGAWFNCFSFMVSWLDLAGSAEADG